MLASFRATTSGDISQPLDPGMQRALLQASQRGRVLIQLPGPKPFGTENPGARFIQGPTLEKDFMQEERRGPRREDDQINLTFEEDPLEIKNELEHIGALPQIHLNGQIHIALGTPSTIGPGTKEDHQPDPFGRAIAVQGFGVVERFPHWA